MNLKKMPFAEPDIGFWGGFFSALASSAAVFLLLRWLGVVRR
jgi:hypothetical protein